MKVLFFVTGSIAGFKAAQVISRLVQSGCEVQVVATHAALKFVGPATYEGLTGKPVVADLWEDGRAMDHIHLSRWADVGVVCPASANTVAQMALGLAPDVVSASLLAWPREKPLHLFPAMNSQMLDAPPTQENLNRLRDRGVLVHETDEGSLACGETGGGRLLEPDEVVALILGAPRSERRVLVTGGATRESIDGIRFISNVSTGRTAAELCERLMRAGYSVTYLHGPQAQLPRGPVTCHSFLNISSLDHLLRDELSRADYHAVIHCAAVSDYTVENANSERKLASGQELTLHLKPTPKLLPNLKEYSRNKNVRVIGFKLTLNSDLDAAAASVLTPSVDAIVANDWAKISPERHPGFVLTRSKRYDFATVSEMSTHLTFLLTKDQI